MEDRNYPHDRCDVLGILASDVGDLGSCVFCGRYDPYLLAALVRTKSRARLHLARLAPPIAWAKQLKFARC